MLSKLVKPDAYHTCCSKKSCWLVYAPQNSLDDSVKDLLDENLQLTLKKFSAYEILLVFWDFNGHIGKNADRHEVVHGGREFGRRNLERGSILEFAAPST